MADDYALGTPTQDSQHRHDWAEQPDGSYTCTRCGAKADI